MFVGPRSFSWIGSLACGFLLAMAPASGGAGFFSPRTEVPLDETSVIPIRFDKPAAATVELKSSVTPRDVIEIVRPATVLSNESIGYVRVRGWKTGTAELRVADAAITVTVRAERSRVESTLFTPRIVSPAMNSCVWGTFAIGVEFPASAKRVSLQLPDGGTLEPQKLGETDEGPLRRALFTVDAARLGGGAVRLMAMIEQADGAFLSSEPLALTVLPAAPGSLVAGECEAALNGPRPARFGKVPPKVGSRSDASGGAFVMSASAEPAWCLPFEAKEPGLYQVMIVARGEPAVGAFPSVGLVIDNETNPTTAVRLCDRTWQRLPVGHPVHLDAGPHTLTLWFQNDFYVRDLADRNLYLDRYEVARVEADSRKGDPSMQMMQANDTMMSAGSGDGMSIAFVRPFDNEPVTGPLTIEGFCTWPQPETNPPPRVTVLVNGRPTLTQQAADPVFWLDRSFLREGTNTIQLRATLPSCGSAFTPALRVHVAPDASRGSAKPKPLAMVRFDARNDGWDATMKKRWTDKDQPKGHSYAIFASNGAATLRLPEDLVGRFDLSLEAMGDDFKGPPRAAVSLLVGDKETPVAEIDVSGWWNTRKVGTVTLPSGSKQLRIAFVNDLAEGNAGDRNLRLKSVILQESADTLDRHAPRVTLLYPKDNQTVYGVDAVVAEAFDDRTLAGVDVVVDGVPLGMTETSPSGVGRFVFPLLARSLTTGRHRLSLTAQDPAGNVGESEEISFIVSAQPPGTPGPYARAVRLLQHFAFGPDPDELAAVLTMGETAWLTDRLGRSFDTPGERAILEYGKSRFPDDRNGYEVTLRVADFLMRTDNPVRARFVYWVQNHFSTWIRKVEAPSKWDEHLRFSRLGVAPFGDLLFASATSPAMLVYLDQRRSFANSLNENYAREIMELHTLGVHGGYTQRDVTEMAKLLTGWTLSDEADESGRGQPLAREFRFDPRVNDGADHRALGVEFAACPPSQRYDRVRFALEILASHPSTAKFVCRKLVDHYVSVRAPDAMVDDLARVFLDTGGDMKAVLLALAQHPGFWNPGTSTRLMTPLDYGVRLARVCRDTSPWGVNDFLQRSGMGIFDHAMPNGYPEDDEAYADSNGMMQRWRFAKQERWVLNRLVPGPWRSPRGGVEEWRQNVVDAVAARLTGRLLSEKSNEAALDVLRSAPGKSWEQTMQLATFVAQLPEANLK